MDALKLVEVALNWQLVGPQIKYQTATLKYYMVTRCTMLTNM